MRLRIVHDNELASSITSVHNRCFIGLQTFGTIIASICVNRWTSYLSCFLRSNALLVSSKDLSRIIGVRATVYLSDEPKFNFWGGNSFTVNRLRQETYARFINSLDLLITAIYFPKRKWNFVLERFVKIVTILVSVTVNSNNARRLTC